MDRGHIKPYGLRIGCHLSSYASQSRWANTFGNIVYTVQVCHLLQCKTYVWIRYMLSWAYTMTSYMAWSLGIPSCDWLPCMCVLMHTLPLFLFQSSIPQVIPYTRESNRKLLITRNPLSEYVSYPFKTDTAVVGFLHCMLTELCSNPPPPPNSPIPAPHTHNPHTQPTCIPERSVHQSPSNSEQKRQREPDSLD